MDKIAPARSMNTISTNTIPPPLAHLYVNANRKHVKILFQDILYIESLKDYVRIHTSTQKIMTKDKISLFEHKLPDHFIRVHRSFIVNIHKITAFTHQDIEIDTIEIPIGISYKKEVLFLLKGN